MQAAEKRPICSVVRPPHNLGGVAKSRSLFVATPPLILPRVKARGRLVVIYVVVNDFKPFTTKDFGPPRKRDFAKLNLHLPACRSLGGGRDIFEQPEK